MSRTRDPKGFLSAEEDREVRAIRRAAASPAGRKARMLRNRQAHRDADGRNAR